MTLLDWPKNVIPKGYALRPNDPGGQVQISIKISAHSVVKTHATDHSFQKLYLTIVTNNIHDMAASYGG